MTSVRPGSATAGGVASSVVAAVGTVGVATAVVVGVGAVLAAIQEVYDHPRLLLRVARLRVYRVREERAGPRGEVLHLQLLLQVPLRGKQ